MRLAVTAACLLAAPVHAQTAASLELAAQAYATGKTSGFTPQTTGEKRMCAAYWDAMHFMRTNDVMPEAAWQRLGDDFRADSMLVRKIGFAVDAGEGDLRSDKFKQAADVAMDRFIGFISADDDKTRKLFENLGVCHKRSS